MFDGENEKSGDLVMPASYVHVDSRRIKDLFLKHKNVKLCISGDEHQYDQVVYNDVTSSATARCAAAGGAVTISSARTATA